MNSTQNLTAATLAGVAWIEDGKRANFQSARGYGVRNAAGEWLTFDGVRPYNLARKSTATEVAETIIDGGTLQWMRAL